MLKRDVLYNSCPVLLECRRNRGYSGIGQPIQEVNANDIRESYTFTMVICLTCVQGGVGGLRWWLVFLFFLFLLPPYSN